MNNDEFLKKLSAVTDWQFPKIEDDTPPRGRGRPTEEELEWLANRHSLVGEKLKTVNDTCAPQILKVHCQSIDCPDCGQHCEGGRRVEIKRYFAHGGSWRKQCMNCKLFRDPRTGKFTLTSKLSSAVYQGLHRNKGVYRSKYQSLPKATSEQTMQYHTEETTEFLVRKLVEDSKNNK
jgi:hypothetical protein